MAEAKAAIPAVPLFGSTTPAEALRSKQARDLRRKAIRAQNASSRK